MIPWQIKCRKVFKPRCLLIICYFCFSIFSEISYISTVIKRNKSCLFLRFVFRSSSFQSKSSQKFQVKTNLIRPHCNLFQKISNSAWILEIFIFSSFSFEKCAIIQKMLIYFPLFSGKEGCLELQWIGDLRLPWGGWATFVLIMYNILNTATRFQQRVWLLYLNFGEYIHVNVRRFQEKPRLYNIGI